jgi:hypothetical protein
MSRPRDWPAPGTVFAYPDEPHRRRHGPRGYVDDEHYKPWLRDEFSFRCVYCLCREVWFPDGDRNFGVEHTNPTSLAPEGLTGYDTLVYACCQCNAVRRAALLPLNPCDPLGEHLEVARDGTIRGLTPTGDELIQICRLDRPNLTAFRQLMLDMLTVLGRKRQAEVASLLQRFLAYPANLPDLAVLKPPGGNARPDGLADSSFERRRRDELPEGY